jgi:hypothetical protein
MENREVVCRIPDDIFLYLRILVRKVRTAPGGVPEARYVLNLATRAVLA